MEEMVKLFVDNGTTVAIIVYFLYKDYKFNSTIIEVLTSLREVVGEIRKSIRAEE